MSARGRGKLERCVFFMLEAGDSSTLIHTFVQNRTAQRQIACGQRHSKSSQELNWSFAVGGIYSWFYFELYWTDQFCLAKVQGLKPYRMCQCSVTAVLKADVTPLSDWCQRIRWFIIPIRPMRDWGVWISQSSLADVHSSTVWPYQLQINCSLSP